MTADDEAMPKPTVAELVRHQRALAELTVVDAAKAAGVSRSTWTEIEKGQAIPKEDTLGRVARAIELDANLLLAAAGYSSSTTANDWVEHGMNMFNQANQGSYSKGTTVRPVEDVDVMRLVVDIAERLGRIEEQLRQLDDDVRQLRSPAAPKRRPSASKPGTR